MPGRPKQKPNRKFLRLTIPEGVHPMVRRFFAICREKRLSIEAVAFEAGLSGSAMYHWRCRRKCGPSVVVLDQALRPLGYQLAIVPVRSREAEIHDIESHPVTKCPSAGSGRLPHYHDDAHPWRPTGQGLGGARLQVATRKGE